MLKIKQQALTFDDVLLVPAHSSILPNQTDLSTNLTSSIALPVPLLSAAMDTVTESELAIAMAQEGGIGFIHKNMSICDQVFQVQKVKKYEAGIVQDPVTVSESMTLKEVLSLSDQLGFSSFPVVDTSQKLVGLVTRRDMRFISDTSLAVAELMTPKYALITVNEGCDKKEIRQLMQAHRIEKVLMVNAAFELKGLITVKDFTKAEQHPNATKDEWGRLRVGAAVGCDEHTATRVQALVDADVDVIVVDSSHGHSQFVLDCIASIRALYPKLQIIGGNVATASGALALVEAGVNAVKVGIGPGSICTTRIVTGVGVPQITAISDVAQALNGSSIPVIADGGLRFSGDIAKAIAAGASTVMIGSMFAGTDESPGSIVLYQGRSYKSYRGMGSLAAMSSGSGERYFQKTNQHHKGVPEGIEGRVPYKGALKDIIHQITGGLRSCMGLVGTSTLQHLKEQAEFVQVTPSGMKESHVHDVSITKEAPNYRSSSFKS
tara:strand:+ start:65 stop:1540 length:1476 start_codon:yes stop_codon:yes gene_type:complete